MMGKLISEGTHATRVITDTGAELKGITSINWRLAGAGEVPMLDVQIAMVDAEAAGHLRVFCVHPEGGDLSEVARIVFADGREWVAP